MWEFDFASQRQSIDMSPTDNGGRPITGTWKNNVGLSLDGQNEYVATWTGEKKSAVLFNSNCNCNFRKEKIKKNKKNKNRK